MGAFLIQKNSFDKNLIKMYYIGKYKLNSELTKKCKLL
jgi:hypothetical protein